MKSAPFFAPYIFAPLESPNRTANHQKLVLNIICSEKHDINCVVVVVSNSGSKCRAMLSN